MISCSFLEKLTFGEVFVTYDKIEMVGKNLNLHQKSL